MSRSSTSERRPRARAGQGGSTLVEMVTYLSVAATMLVLLAGSMLHLTRSSRMGIDSALLQAQARRIVDRLAAELLQASTQRDHMEPSDLELPLPSNSPANTVNEAYNFPAESIGTLHDTVDRDGNEYFHTVDAARRYYIYATYQAFDTLQFQKVRFELDQALDEDGEIEIAWTVPRKVFLQGDQVLLRAFEGGALRTYVLGDHVRSLEFHVTRTGELEVRLELGSRSGVTLDYRVALPTRNDLG